MSGTQLPDTPHQEFPKLIHKPHLTGERGGILSWFREQQRHRTICQMHYDDSRWSHQEAHKKLLSASPHPSGNTGRSQWAQHFGTATNASLVEGRLEHFSKILNTWRSITWVPGSTGLQRQTKDDVLSVGYFSGWGKHSPKPPWMSRKKKWISWATALLHLHI